MPVPNMPSALDLDIRAGLVGVSAFVILRAFAIAEGPQLHALHDAPVGIAKDSVVVLELVCSLKIIVDVDAEYAQHVLVVAVPAIVDPVVKRPVRDFRGSVAHGAAHRDR